MISNKLLYVIDNAFVYLAILVALIICVSYIVKRLFYRDDTNEKQTAKSFENGKSIVIDLSEQTQPKTNDESVAQNENTGNLNDGIKQYYINRLSEVMKSQSSKAAARRKLNEALKENKELDKELQDKLFEDSKQTLIKATRALKRRNGSSLAGVDLTNKRRIYVIGDLHGCFVSMDTILNRIGVFNDKNGGTNGGKRDSTLFNPNRDAIVFTGDYLDRGVYSVVCLLYTAKLVNMFPQSVYVLRGNHEYADMYLMNGTLGHSNVMFGTEHTEEFLKVLYEYVSSMKIYAYTTTTIICHGIIPCCYVKGKYGDTFKERLANINSKESVIKNIFNGEISKLEESKDFDSPECPVETIAVWGDIIDDKHGVNGRRYFNLSINDWNKFKESEPYVDENGNVYDFKYIIKGHDHESVDNVYLKESGVYVNVSNHLTTSNKSTYVELRNEDMRKQPSIPPIIHTVFVDKSKIGFASRDIDKYITNESEVYMLHEHFKNVFGSELRKDVYKVIGWLNKYKKAYNIDLDPLILYYAWN